MKDSNTEVEVSTVTANEASFLMDLNKGEKLTNWAGNYEYSTQNIYYPTSIAEVQEVVKRCSKLKVLGSRHCFNSIADSADNFISLKHLDNVVHFDTNGLTVTIEAGMNYGKLAEYLYSKGYALHNLASLPHISVAGACTTATHGSGDKNGNLSTAVIAIELVDAGGEIRRISLENSPDDYHAVVVGLGAFGVITRLKLKIEPAFLVSQNVYQNLPLEQLKDNLETIFSAGYSVSLFTDWQSEMFTQVWIKRRVEEGADFIAEPEFFGAKAATEDLHPLAGMSAENCTEQLGVPGAWHERLPHFKMGFTPSNGEEMQSEFFVAREHAYEAIKAVSTLREQLAPQLFVSEIRTINADSFWLSPSYEQSSVGIHFTWKRNWEEVRKLIPLIEEKLAPFNAKPHWGKLFTMAPARLQRLYEKMPDFQELVKAYDPNGKFINQYLATNIFGERGE